MAKKIPSEKSNLKSKISNPQSLRVLIVEDSEDDVLLIIRELKKGGYDSVYERVETEKAMSKALREKPWDIILCDYKLPKFSGTEAIALLKETNIDIPLIIVSGTISEETAIECMRLGAQDYIMKDNLSRLCPAIARELEETEIRNKQKQVEEALRQSEEKYRTILENIEDGYYEVDLKGNFTFFNASMCRILGYPPEEMMGMNNRQFTDKENAKKLFQAFNEVYKTGEPAKEFDWQIIRKDGTKRYIETSISLHKDSSGKLIGFRGIIRDITERKHTAEALRESEKYFKEITENSSDMIIITDKKGDIKYCSRSVERFTGYRPEELIGRNTLTLIHPDDKKRAVGDFGKAILTIDSAIPNAFRIVHKDGSERYFDGLGKNLLDNPAVAGFIMNVRDITSRKQAEEALQVSEEKYRLFVENAKEAIIIAQDLKVVFFNRAAMEMIEYTGDISEPKAFIDFIHPDDRNMAVDHHVRRLKGEEVPSAYSFRILREDGTVKWVEFNTAVIQWKERPATLYFLNDITARKQAEEKLQKSEEKYRNIIENIQEGYFEIDFTGNFTFINDAECRNIGYSREELIGMNNRRYQDEATARKMYQLFINLYKTGEPIKALGIEIIRKNGTKGFNEVSLSLIRDAEDKPIGFRGVSRDITERKKMEEDLRKSEEKYRTILETMQEGYFEVDLSGNFTFVNDASCRYIGYTKEEMIGTNSKHFQDETTAEKMFQLCLDIYRTGESITATEAVWIKRDGTKENFEASMSLIRDTKGNPIGFRGVSRNITERKKTEEALRQSEEKYRTILETMQDGYFETDLAGIFTFVNEAECRNLGYTHEELLSMGPGKYADEKRIKELTNLFIEIYRTGIPVQAYNLELTKKDGTKSFNEISVSLKRNFKGEPYGFRGISRDVTERKQAEEERKQSFERMRKALGATVQSISMAVEMKDPYTSGHQRRVSDLARSIATEMGLSADRQDFIRTASSIHDIGKIAIPSEILSKPTKLTELEFSLIKIHSQSGYAILKDIEFPWPVADVVLQHHERMNGSGYPQGLKGDDIPLEARIMAVADVVEAIASHRPYRPALGIEVALEEIEKNKGILYDNTVADACLRLFREKSYQFP